MSSFSHFFLIAKTFLPPNVGIGGYIGFFEDLEGKVGQEAGNIFPFASSIDEMEALGGQRWWELPFEIWWDGSVCERDADF